MSKNKEKQRNFEHKMASPAKWPKCTYDTLALSRWITFVPGVVGAFTEVEGLLVIVVKVSSSYIGVVPP